MKEFLELDQERKWEYLKRYYEVAAKFYDIKETVVTDDEIDACIRIFKEKPSPKIRRERRLTTWNFKFDENDEGIRNGYHFSSHDESKWQKANLPHSHRFIPKDPVRFARTEYFQVAPEKGQYAIIWQGKYWTWYKNRVRLDEIEDDQVAYLAFDGVNLLSDVWVNDFPVMLDHLGLFPFKTEMTEQVRKRKEAVISVRVANTVSNLPTMFYNGQQVAYANPPYSEGRETTDWFDLAWSGIGGVTLLVLNKNHMQDAFLYTEDIVKEEAVLRCRVTLRNTSSDRFHGRIKIEVSKWLPTEGSIIKVAAEDVHVLPMNERKVELCFTVENPSLWTIDKPNMYLAHIVLEDRNGRAIDDLCETFGIRTIKIVGTHFYLNNEKIIPRGTHDSCNYFGESMIYPSDKAIMRDILLHKKMGATCSRWPSDTRVNYARIAEYADQLGYMLSWTGFYEMWISHPEMELYHTRDAKAMAISLRNRPSIIMWEMADEVLYGIQDYRRLRWYEQIYKLVNEEDDSRPIVPAGNFAMDLAHLVANYRDKGLTTQEKRNKVLEDYPVYNLPLVWWDYHYTPGTTGEPIGPIYPSLKWVKDMLGGVKPTVLTEFGLDGMPSWDKVINVYGKFTWASYGWWPISRKKVDLSYYGRGLRQQDWKETQACQAIVLNNIIGYLRENADEFSAIYFISMFDVWNYFWGVVDVNANAKLGYHIVKSDYQPNYVSGLHGNTVLRGGDRIEITVSNFGEAVSEASLRICIRDTNNNAVRESAVLHDWFLASSLLG